MNQPYYRRYGKQKHRRHEVGPAILQDILNWLEGKIGGLRRFGTSIHEIGNIWGLTSVYFQGSREIEGGMEICMGRGLHMYTYIHTDGVRILSTCLFTRLERV